MNPLIIAALALTLNSQADINPAQVKPVLSAAGIQKLKTNIQILDQNLSALNENLSTIQFNIATLQKEMATLNEIKKEHLQLKARYQQYLDLASKVTEKNSKVSAKLKEWEMAEQKRSQQEPSQDQTTSALLQSKLEAVKLEQGERSVWSQDAKAKIARVESLITMLNGNLREIENQKGPLQQQITEWKEREREYRKTVDSLQSKKASINAQLQGQ